MSCTRAAPLLPTLPHLAALTCGDDAHRSLFEGIYNGVQAPGIRAVWLHLHKLLLLAGGRRPTCCRCCNLPKQLLLAVRAQLDVLLLLMLMPGLSGWPPWRQRGVGPARRDRRDRRAGCRRRTRRLHGCQRRLQGNS